MIPQIPPTPVKPIWVRPPQWLAIPSLPTEGIIGLLAITNDDSNYVALMCQGAYSVDWGDGTGPHNFASGVVAQNQYTFSTFDSGNLTLTSQGYKQALVTIRPQTSNTLTTVNLQQKHSSLSVSAAYCTPWLDLALNIPNCTTLIIGGTTITRAWLQRVNLIALGAVTGFNLYNCYSLQSFIMAPITSLTTCNSMFYGCNSLRAVPLFNTASVTIFTSMFLNCYTLQSIPLFDTSLGQSFSNMFYGCSSLQSVPLFNTAAGNTFSSMFYGCASLQTVPLLNTALGTNFSTMFGLCVSLQSVPLINTAAGTTFSSMFISCPALQSIPAINTAAGTVFTSMLTSCSSLASGSFAGTKYSISYANCKMSEAALVAVFTALGTCSGQTITVTGTYGDAALTAADKLIATTKGWTVAA